MIVSDGLQMSLRHVPDNTWQHGNVAIAEQDWQGTQGTPDGLCWNFPFFSSKDSDMISHIAGA
ncbi:hypothetical protein BELL_0315g00090 [Botrytis elliptica]|uniref:Uncharacterized protein n=1 Tax=Botrytis elliptica TaxID=278938 RepID=A0A4Z1JJY1_9HELO|nr:hypothetical protein BELL_0315g00090 [Botrytis elliptica]